MSSLLPEVLNHFNIYNDAEKMIGVSGEIDLGELSAITDTIEGSGVLGEYEDAVTGHFENSSIKIPFATLHGNLFDIIDTTDPPQLTLRGAMQCMDPGTGKTGYYPLKVVIKGKATSTTLGKATNGKKMEAEVEIAWFYLKITINNSTAFELDKFNFKFILNGKDMLSKIRSMI